jgi:hypothetical protein
VFIQAAEPLDHFNKVKAKKAAPNIWLGLQSISLFFVSFMRALFQP